MNTASAQLLKTECESAFDFLVKDYGFAPAVLEIDHKINFATVTFKGTNLAIECIYDERESCLELKVARVINGVTATEYAVNAAGERGRESLFHLLLERGLRGLGLKEMGLPARPIDEQFRITLNRYAELLQTHGKDILKNSATVLGPRSSQGANRSDG